MQLAGFLSTLAICMLATSSFAQSLKNVVAAAQPKIVKIMGSGGFQGLEPYQTGLLISSDGYILTCWSYVLDSDSVSVMLDDGQRFASSLVGYDPRIEIAVLKLAAEDLPHFELKESIDAKPGTQILASAIFTASRLATSQSAFNVA